MAFNKPEGCALWPHWLFNQGLILSVSDKSPSSMTKRLNWNVDDLCTFTVYNIYRQNYASTWPSHPNCCPKSGDHTIIQSYNMLFYAVIYIYIFSLLSSEAKFLSMTVCPSTQTKHHKDIVYRDWCIKIQLACSERLPQSNCISWGWSRTLAVCHGFSPEIRASPQ